MRATRQRGPLERAARQEIRDRGFEPNCEKSKTLATLARFHDEGRDPSIRELSRRARVHRMAIVWKLKSLERDGVISVIDPGDLDLRRKAIYRLNFSPAASEPAAAAASTEEANVPTTKTKSKTTKAAAPTLPIALPLPSFAPGWAKNMRWLPDGDFEIVPSPLLTKVRRRHEAALGKLRAAQNPTEQAAALVGLADLVEEQITMIRRELPDLEAASEEAAAGARPQTIPRVAEGRGSMTTLAERGGVAVDQDPEGDAIEAKIGAEMVELRPRREAVERDVDRVRELLGLIAPDTMRPTGQTVPRLVAQAQRLREDLAAAPPEKSLDERVADLEAARA